MYRHDNRTAVKWPLLVPCPIFMLLHIAGYLRGGEILQCFWLIQRYEYLTRKHSYYVSTWHWSWLQRCAPPNIISNSSYKGNAKFIITAKFPATYNYSIPIIMVAGTELTCGSDQLCVETARSDYSEALKLGEVPVSYGRVMMIGPGGAGKSSLLLGLRTNGFQRMQRAPSSSILLRSSIAGQKQEGVQLNHGQTWERRMKFMNLQATCPGYCHQRQCYRQQRVPKLFALFAPLYPRVAW